MGREVSADDRDQEGGIGTIHAVPGVPADAAAGDLYDELDRVTELPATQNFQEPRPLSQHPVHCQAAVTGHLQHRRQTSRRTRDRTRQTRPHTKSVRPPRRRTDRHELETSTRPTHRGLPRTHQPLPLTPNAYTVSLTSSASILREHAIPESHETRSRKSGISRLARSLTSFRSRRGRGEVEPSSQGTIDDEHHQQTDSQQRQEGSGREEEQRDHAPFA